MDTRSLVMKLLSRLGAGDAEGAAALFAEAVEFEIPHHADVWWIPEVRTRQDLAGFFAGLGSHLEAVRFEVDHVLVDGEEAVVLGLIEDRVRRTGVSFTSPFALHLSLRGGRFTRYRFFEDSAAAHLAARG